MVCSLCRGRLKLYFIAVILVILMVLTYLSSLIKYQVSSGASVPSSLTRNSRHLSKLITVVFRQFEEYDNDIADSVQSFVSVYPNMPVVVLCDKMPYPPFSFSLNNETLHNVKVVSLELQLKSTPQDLNPLSYIFTDFVLFAPDSVRVSRRVLQQVSATAIASPAFLISIAVGNAHLVCQNITWKYEDWTLIYSKISSGKVCKAVHGHHALLIKTSLLHLLPQPFIMPFPESLYLQTFIRNISVQIFNGKLGAGRAVLKSPTSRDRASHHLKENRITLYKQLGVKAVIRDGLVQWFGCKKETERCFPSVQGTPSYILLGRNTPPCCRRNLRRTIFHVLKILTQVGARCWLETTSLLGAIVRHDLLPWTEYAEIGVHASDVGRVTWLQRGGVDAEGFVWERATRGRYYTVSFSATNRINILILPFTPRNGTMWPVDWVLAHQRDFPERHLHPLAQVNFAGHQAPAPNDARAFLDHKLGPGAIERTNKLKSKLIYP